MYVCMHAVRGAFFFFFFFFFTLTLLATNSIVVGRAKSRFTNVTRLASLAVQNVRGRFSRAVILEDQIVQLSYFENNSQPTQAPTVFEYTRSDLCVIDHATKMCLIVEVFVPFDAFVNDCYQSKLN